MADLAEVEEEMAGLVDGSPQRAVDLCETFLAGCYEKSEEIDDSSCSLRHVRGQLGGRLGQVRQASSGDPGETAARLLAWMDVDQYGYLHRLDSDVAAVLDKVGRAAFIIAILNGSMRRRAPVTRGSGGPKRCGPCTWRAGTSRRTST